MIYRADLWNQIRVIKYSIARHWNAVIKQFSVCEISAELHVKMKLARERERNPFEVLIASRGESSEEGDEYSANRIESSPDSPDSVSTELH